MAKEKITTDLTVPEVFEIGALSINKEKLQALIAEDTKLVINGITDTAGYKEAVAKRGQYRTLRTSLEKHRKDLSKPQQDFIKSLKTATDSLGELAYTGEEYFDAMITAVDTEKERIKQEKLLEQQRRVSGRVSLLTEHGAKFDGEYYTFDYNEDINVSLADVQSWADETFASHLSSVIVAHNIEIERLDEIARQEEQQEQERKGEALRVQQQAEANEQKAKELRLKRETLISKEIKLLGGVLQEDGTFLFPSKDKFHLAPLSALVDYSDEQWEALVADIESYVPEPVIKPGTSLDESRAADSANENLSSRLVNAYLSDTVEPLGQASELNPDYESESRRAGIWLGDNLEATLTFTLDNPYTDIYITPKMKMRFFPSEYESLSMDGVSDVANKGYLQGINWIILKR